MQAVRLDDNIENLNNDANNVQALSTSLVQTLPANTENLAITNAENYIAEPTKTAKVLRKSSVLNTSGISALITNTSQKFKGINRSTSQNTLASQSNGSASNNNLNSNNTGATSPTSVHHKHVSATMNPSNLVATAEEPGGDTQKHSLMELSGVSPTAVNWPPAAPIFVADPMVLQTGATTNDRGVYTYAKPAYGAYIANWVVLSKKLQLLFGVPPSPFKLLGSPLSLPTDTTLEELNQLVLNCARESPVTFYYDLASLIATVNSAAYEQLASSFDSQSAEFACYPELTGCWTVYMSSVVPLIEAIALPSRSLVAAALSSAMSSGPGYPKLTSIKHPFNIRRLCFRAFRDIIVIPLAPVLKKLVEPISASPSHFAKLTQMLHILSCFCGDEYAVDSLFVDLVDVYINT